MKFAANLNIKGGISFFTHPVYDTVNYPPPLPRVYKDDTHKTHCNNEQTSRNKYGSKAGDKLSSHCPSQIVETSLKQACFDYQTSYKVVATRLIQS